MNEGEKQNPSFVGSLAGDTKKGFDDAAALPDRLSRYSLAHQRTLVMSDYIKANVKIKPYQHLPVLLKNCGDYLVFRDYFTVGKIKLSAATFCKKHLLCPLCAIRRGAKTMKAYLDKLEVIKTDHPKIKAYLVTLTVKNGPDLYERFSHIQNSVKEYHVQRRNAFKGLRQSVEANKALGAVWSYEFKRGKGSDLWHPHLHAVWLGYEDPNPVELSREWLAITGDSFIVDVRPFEDQNDIVGGFLEVFKYAVKFSDLPLADNWHGFEVLSNKRLVSSFGLFRGVEIPESMLDESLDDLPYVEMFYKFIKGAGYSLKSVTDPRDDLNIIKEIPLTPYQKMLKGLAHGKQPILMEK